MNSKKGGQQVTIILAIDWGTIKQPPSSTRKLEAATEESSQIPVTTSPAQPEELKTSEVQVIEVDFTTRDELEEEQDICTISPPSRQTHRSREERKLQRQSSEDTLDNLSTVFDNNLLAELTSEDTWIDE